MAAKLARLRHFIRARIERAFPEKRLFLRSDTETRFVRLTPMSQFVALTGSGAVVGWAIIASAILLMDSIGSGNFREQAAREQMLYEERLNALSEERDRRAEEAAEAHERFALALAEVSQMQARLLELEERRKELSTGMEALQATLRDTLAERDAERATVERLTAELAESQGALPPEIARLAELDATVDHLTATLGATAALRDEIASASAAALTRLEEMEFERQLVAERNERIFQQIEEAVAVSLAPLDEMFQSAGLPADSIIETVRRNYSGQGGPLTPITLSTKGEPADPDSLRANEILARLDELNLYRIAVEKTPFANPVRGTYRFTSGFGMRSDPIHGGTRMHNGADFAGARGTPIHATADGVVIHAGWSSGYGRLIKIQHEFGIETRYAHLSKIHVEVGQRVSRGERIGDMGNTGRSTGTHLHYEVRLGGTPKNPMTYIKAARDVF